MTMTQRNEAIYYEFTVLRYRQKTIATRYGLAEKTVKLIIGKVRKNARKG